MSLGQSMPKWLHSEVQLRHPKPQETVFNENCLLRKANIAPAIFDMDDDVQH